MRATIKDVAKLSGFSISTVSLTLNNHPGVREETRRRILQAVEKLNYRPNRQAQGLIKKRTQNISVVISGPEYEHFSSPILFEVIKGVVEALRSSDYELLLNITTAKEEAAFIRNHLQDHSCDGLIIWGSRMSEQDLGEICGHSVPVVVIGRHLGETGSYSVTADDFKGGYIATRHLLELGHTKIGYIGELSGISSAEERLAGYYRALTEFGIGIDRNLVVPADFYKESGYWGMRKILKHHSSGMTAVFTGSDLMALGAIEAIFESGLAIPDDLSLVGFDNMPIAHLLIVPLTTIGVPLFQLGKEAGNKLLRLLNKETVDFLTRLDVSIVERGSTGARVKGVGV